MAAVIPLHPADRSHPHAPVGRTAPPRLVVIEGGRSDVARRRRRIYVVRRAMALVLLGCVLWAGALVMGTIGGEAAANGTSDAVASTHLVRPGDNLWKIAASLHRGGDLRAVVDRLAEFNGTDELHPGQTVRIPADLAS